MALKGGLTMQPDITQYKIAEYIISSDIPKEFLKNNFPDYEITSDESPDITVKLIYDEKTALTSDFIDIDNYKYYKYDNGIHTYICKNNQYVNSCIISYRKNAVSEIFILLKSADYIDEIIKREVTYAFMNSFYIILVSDIKLSFHSCGFIYNKKGILLSGDPGSGKSTILKMLSNKFNLKVVGEDINACSFSDSLQFYGMPWCRINQNIKADIFMIIFLGNENKKLSEKELYDALMQNEFCLGWIKDCRLYLKHISHILYTNVSCYMVNNKKNNETYLEVEKLVQSV